MDLGLRDRACIVTGAARGIGRATAKMLAAERANVLLVGRGEDALARVAQTLGERSSVVAADITERDACERILRVAWGVLTCSSTTRGRAR